MPPVDFTQRAALTPWNVFGGFLFPVHFGSHSDASFAVTPGTLAGRTLFRRAPKNIQSHVVAMKNNKFHLFIFASTIMLLAHPLTGESEGTVFAESVPLSRAEASVADIEGTDRISVLYFRNLIDEIQPLLDRFFGTEQARVRAARVTVILVPRDESGLRESFRIDWENDRWVGRLRWGAETSREDVFSFVNRLLLVRIKQAALPRTEIPTAELPAWLEAALLVRLQTHFTPALRDEMSRLALVMSPLPLRSIASLRRNEIDWANTAQVYWFLHYLEALAGNRSNLAPVLREALRGGDFIQFLGRTFAGRFPTIDEIEMDWAMSYFHLARERRGPVMDLDESFRQVILLSRFDLLDPETGREMRVGLADLWRWRDLPGVRSEVQARVLRLRIILAQINPVYFNTLHALGLIFESLESFRREEEWRAALQDYETEWDYARFLHREVRLNLVGAN